MLFTVRLLLAGNAVAPLGATHAASPVPSLYIYGLTPPVGANSVAALPVLACPVVAVCAAGLLADRHVVILSTTLSAGL